MHHYHHHHHRHCHKMHQPGPLSIPTHVNYFISIVTGPSSVSRTAVKVLMSVHIPHYNRRQGEVCFPWCNEARPRSHVRYNTPGRGSRIKSVRAHLYDFERSDTRTRWLGWPRSQLTRPGLTTSLAGWFMVHLAAGRDSRLPSNANNIVYLDYSWRMSISTNICYSVASIVFIVNIIFSVTWIYSIYILIVRNIK